MNNRGETGDQLRLEREIHVVELSARRKYDSLLKCLERHANALRRKEQSSPPAPILLEVFD
jgi:hypothetical protein